jgi:hypothetical protein
MQIAERYRPGRVIVSPVVRAQRRGEQGESDRGGAKEGKLGSEHGREGWKRRDYWSDLAGQHNAESMGCC